MGWYGSSESGSNTTNRNNRGSNRNRQSQRSGGNYLPNPAIEKIIEGKFIGQGVKWTPAYECKVSPEELLKYREEFWNTRTQGNQEIWSILRNAIDAEPADAEAMIKATGLTPHAGIMTLIFDDQRFPYRIPIAIINEPEGYLPDEMEQLDEAEKPEEEQLEGLKIRYFL